MTKGRWAALVVAAVAWALSACGGGGGGGSSSSGGGLTVNANKSSLAFVAFVGQQAPAENVQFSLSGGSGTYYGLAEPDVQGRFGVGFQVTSDTTATVTLTPFNNIGQPPGSVSGSVSFKLCRDINCTQVAWQRSLPYTLDTYGLSVSQLSISGSEGAVSAAQTVTLTPADPANRLTLTASSALNPWLTVSRTSASTYSVVASGSGLAAGSYQGELELFHTTVANGSLKVPVAFTVGNGTIAPPARSATLDAAATGASLGGSFPVAFVGSQAPTWTATSDQPWLVLTGATGTGAGSVQYSVNPSLTSAVPNWTSATANITLSASGLTPVSFPFTLNKRLPEVFTVSPNPLAANHATSLKVSGRGFTQLTPSRTLQISGVAGTTTTVISDTQATLAVPATTAATRTVSVANAAGLATRSAPLAIQAVPTLAYAAVPASGEVRSSLFDATRNAVYAVNLTEGALVRHRFNGSSWVTTALPIAEIGDMAMSPDKATLYVSSGVSQLLEVDPDTLQARTTRTLDSSNGLMTLGVGRFVRDGLSITSDLKIWFANDGDFSALTYFDIIGATFGSQTQGLPEASTLLRGAMLAAPADGSRLFVAQSTGGFDITSYLYDAGTGQLAAPAGAPTNVSARYSHNGARLLAERSQVHDGASLALLGQVQPTGSGILTASVLSPDGSRVYALVSANDNTLIINRVEVFDTTQLAAGTSHFVKLGEIAVTDQALDCGPQGLSGCSNVLGSLNVSPHGNTLFWLGNARLVVLPIPAGLRTAPLAVPRLMPAAR